MGMIHSLLDNDQYKFTMQQALLKLGYAATPVEYRFKCRNKGVDFTPIISRVWQAIKELEGLRLTKEEYDYLRSIKYFSEEYLCFLKNFSFDSSLVTLLDKYNGEMSLRIQGPWFHTILFEVPILAIISELYGKYYGESISVTEYSQNFCNKLNQDFPDDFLYADFGTRRRYNLAFQNEVVTLSKKLKPKNFVGTSNLYLAMTHGVKPIGTMAHEWLQAHQQLGFRIIDSQKAAFDNWVKAYRGRLGIALSDVINTDVFLSDFNDPYYLKLFDGVREDSEPDPIKFGHRIINLYLFNHIDPKTKTIVFSNSLNFEKALKIHSQLHNLINCSFGIGTFLTNDTPFALNIVLKMVKCNGQPVAKLSNEPGKGMCEDESYIKYLKSVFKVN